MSLASRTSRSTRLAKSAIIALASQQSPHVSFQPYRRSSSTASSATQQGAPSSAVAKDQDDKQQATASPKAAALKKKTMAELDEELRLKLEGISGDGGASGVEYENGKAEGLKRNVKKNMFRVI